MAKQYVKVQGVGGGRGPMSQAHAVVLQAYADVASKKKKKKSDGSHEA